MRIIKAIIISVLAVVAAACERYQTVPENSPFLVMCTVNDGTISDGAMMNLAIAQGAVSGECQLSLSLKEKETGASPSYRIMANGRTQIGETDSWSFDENGLAKFVIMDLPTGKYHLKINVRRWYHSASAEADFEIKL